MVERMADVRCLRCGNLNPPDLEECQFCGASLKPAPAGSESIKPGQVPTKKNTAELERALPTWLRSVRKEKRPAAGESLAEPSADDNPPALPADEPAGDNSLPLTPPVPISPDEFGELPDWLKGLGSAASADEEDDAVPEWLAGLRGGTPPAESVSTSSSQLQPEDETDSADWMARLDNQPQETAPSTPEAAKAPTFDSQSGIESLPGPATVDNTPDWLKSMQSIEADAQAPASGQSTFETSAGSASGNETPGWLQSLQSAQAEPQEPPSPEQAPTFGRSAFETPLGSAVGDETPDWLQSLQSAQSEPQEPPSPEQAPTFGRSAFETPLGPAMGDETPDWLQSLQSTPSEPQETPAAPPGGEGLPEWLAGLPGLSSESSESSSGTLESAALPESTPDWLDQLDQDTGTAEPAQPAAGSEPVPDWLSSFGSAPGTPTSSAGENVPEWLTNLEAKSGPESGTPVPSFNNEPEAAGPAPEGKPDWLKQLQADTQAAQDVEQHKDDFGVVSRPPDAPKKTGALPNWLTRIEPAEQTTNNAPALIGDMIENLPNEQGDTAYSMESPDWLSKLNPEQAAEKAADKNEDQAGSQDIEAADLPSWVQAMRPVESVVEPKTTLQDESQVTEHSGPLAGLRGVLPAGPGLGALRKPPAYSVKLQVSEGQNRYAEFLDRLVAGETQPRTSERRHLAHNRYLRWLIAVLLLLAAAFPFASNAQVASPTLLEPSDKFASAQILDGLAGNVPVLVAFDYDPALSGELEAVAAPLVDRLLSKGVPLALISTSPTGPALAEHFMQTASLVNVHQSINGQQYVNLGYLAGGPAGILYFAGFPTDAMQLSMDGKPAWGSGPLQGLQNLSDFAAVIILTDNADTGRNWIEQAGPRLGNTPMLMMISAQAEPMIRPYFDSGQLKGLVSGLSDAKIYEQKFDRPGQANHYWNSFQFGMLAVEMIILIGVIWGLIAERLALRKTSRGEA